MNSKKEKRPWHLEEFWGLNKTPSGNNSDLNKTNNHKKLHGNKNCLLYTSPSPRDLSTSRMPSSA